MEDRVCKDEFQTAVGNVLAEFDTIRDEFRRSQISRDAYLHRVNTLRQAGQRFNREFKRAHVIMAAPTRMGNGHSHL
jgi:beta-xylosidase